MPIAKMLGFALLVYAVDWVIAYFEMLHAWEPLEFRGLVGATGVVLAMIIAATLMQRKYRQNVAQGGLGV